MKIEILKDFSNGKNRIFKIHDKRITGKDSDYSPKLYYRFRNAIAENNSGITPLKNDYYVIAPSKEGSSVYKALNELGIKFYNLVKNPKKMQKIISGENKLLRTI